jgi:hypothetical protein
MLLWRHLRSSVLIAVPPSSVVPLLPSRDVRVPLTSRRARVRIGRRSDTNPTFFRRGLEAMPTQGTPTQKEALAEELRLLIRDAFRNPDKLAEDLTVMTEFFRVPHHSDVATVDRVHFLRRTLVPEYLGRLPDIPDCRAIRELFKWEDENGVFVSLSRRYEAAKRELGGLAGRDFGRRQEPRLLLRCAQHFLEFDADDRFAAHSRDEAIADFWGLRSSPGVTLVFPEIPVRERIRQGDLPSKDHVRLAKFADTDTRLELRSFLAREFPDIDVHDFVCTEVPQEDLRRDLIVVGGIGLNDLTEHVLETIGSPFRQISAPAGEPDVLVEVETQEQFGPRYANNMVVNDFGLFARAVNPFAPERQLFLINGVLTHGVLGACRCFTDHELGVKNVRYLSTLTSETEFALLVRVPVVLNHVPPPDLQRDLIKGPRALHATPL